MVGFDKELSIPHIHITIAIKRERSFSSEDYSYQHTRTCMLVRITLIGKAICTFVHFSGVSLLFLAQDSNGAYCIGCPPLVCL